MGALALLYNSSIGSTLFLPMQNREYFLTQQVSIFLGPAGSMTGRLVIILNSMTRVCEKSWLNTAFW